MTPAQTGFLMDRLSAELARSSVDADVMPDGVDEDGIPYGATRMTGKELIQFAEAANRGR